MQLGDVVRSVAAVFFRPWSSRLLGDLLWTITSRFLLQHAILRVAWVGLVPDFQKLINMSTSTGCLRYSGSEEEKEMRLKNSFGIFFFFSNLERGVSR